MNDETPRALYLALLLMLVAGSLIGTRMPIGKAVKMALAWVAIFGVVFVLFAFRDEFSALGQRLRAEATGTAIQSAGELRLPIAEDGHFWVEGKINGHDVPFLVDSGASVTTVSGRIAEASGIALTDRVMPVKTANGTVTMTRGYAGRFQLGPIERTDFAVNVSSRDNINVLGMNFLSSLASWRVEGNYLVLEP